ncbi:uncharacterized protein LOC118479610 isoform X2 [Helianthus annuus]|uniref:uncharacterized protein LOC118479610 isoform X2 n=1 Tax=Helianthus annuus TaxID=4232 RepID=UPI001652C69A|nr:uncharacterized protein LOC118479610 isoform X2 [Helianthus annuus]
MRPEFVNRARPDNNESADPHSQYDPLKKLGLLGVNVRKSESLLELCQASINQAHIDKMEKDVKARVGFSGPIDNLKASNFSRCAFKDWRMGGDSHTG